MLGYELDGVVFSNKRFWRLDTLAKTTRLGRQELLDKLKNLNVELTKHKQHPIELSGEVVAFPEQIREFEALRFAIPAHRFSLDFAERPYCLYLLIFSEQRALNVANLETLLAVSRNTVLADIKRLRKELVSQEIDLKFTRQTGFYLDGGELDIREFAWTAIQQLDEAADYYTISRFLNSSDPLRIFKVNRWLSQLLDEQGIKLVQSRMPAILFFSSCLFARQEQHTLTQADAAKVIHLIDHVEIDRFEGYPAERDYFLGLLIGASDGSLNDVNLDLLYRTSFQIMKNVMRLAAIDFDDFMRTFLTLLAHLTPTYFRLMYHFKIGNPMLTRIKAEYSSLFDLVDKALTPLSELTGSIPESEVAYFVILFGGEIYKRRYRKNPKALVLCVNGISSSLIMRKRLEDLFPSMDFELTASVNALQQINRDAYDLIFSTVSLPSEPKPLYLMSPLPDQEEEIRLYNQVSQDFSLSKYIKPTAGSIYQAISPYISLKAPATKGSLLQIIDKKLKNKSLETGINGLMLSDLITKETIHFTSERLNWEEAIRLAARPLLDKGAIDASYPEAIIQRVKEFGPYIDLGSGICLPHARPEDGVNRIAMNFLRCAQPVRLLDDPAHEVKIFIVLAAVDSDSHLQALSELVTVLGDKDSLQSLLAAANVAEVENILING